MIWPMAKSQMLTSKKPIVAARRFQPRVMQMVRIVLSVTTQVSARKTSTGKMDSSARSAVLRKDTSSLRDKLTPCQAAPGKSQDKHSLKVSRHTDRTERLQAQNRFSSFQRPGLSVFLVEKTLGLRLIYRLEFPGIPV